MLLRKKASVKPWYAQKRTGESRRERSVTHPSDRSSGELAHLCLFGWLALTVASAIQRVIKALEKTLGDFR